VATKKEFLYESFACENTGAAPEAFLPVNLADFWLNGILGSQLSGSESAQSISNAMIEHACQVLVGASGGQMEPRHCDIYLQELILEKLYRINQKAAITNSAFEYLPADVSDIFDGPHYSPEHMATLMKLVGGAIEWEKRWTVDGVRGA
jgi:hypothetical protein